MLFALLSGYWPGLDKKKKMLRLDCRDEQDKRENAEMVLKIMTVRVMARPPWRVVGTQQPGAKAHSAIATPGPLLFSCSPPTTLRMGFPNHATFPPPCRAPQDLGLPYEITVDDIVLPNPQDMMVFVLYLHHTLPQFVPRAAVDFACKLGETQCKELELTNPSKKAISYSARLEGHRDFSIESSSIRIEPKASAKLLIRCTPTNTLSQAARLVLMSKREGGVHAATLVFALQCKVNTRAPLKRVRTEGPLYDMQQFEFTVTNPFPAGESALDRAQLAKQTQCVGWLAACLTNELQRHCLSVFWLRVSCASPMQTGTLRSRSCTSRRSRCPRRRRTRRLPRMPRGTRAPTGERAARAPALVSRLTSPPPNHCAHHLHVTPSTPVPVPHTPASPPATSAPTARPASRPRLSLPADATLGHEDPASKLGRVWPDAFGLDRNRLRLKQNASERIKGFFLPFSMTTAYCTVLFRDKDQGEFCYELVGEPGLPAPIMEVKVRAGLPPSDLCV